MYNIHIYIYIRIINLSCIVYAHSAFRVGPAAEVSEHVNATARQSERLNCIFRANGAQAKTYVRLM